MCGAELDVSVAGVEFADGWEAVIAASPFAIEHSGPDAARVQAATGTSVPLFALDAFAEVSTRNELYYALIGVPASREALLAELGVDTAASVANGTSRRAVTSRSRISRQDRILERHRPRRCD